jgi:2-polyprenyl-3-methyl-5-hydroxy-6-metoxy-1,4-benzoquinol methylase
MMCASNSRTTVEGKFVERLVPGNWAWQVDISAHASRYSFASQFVFGKRVLDAGCGVGYGSRMLASAGASEVIGVDISDEALATARNQFSHSKAKFILDDCEVLGNVTGQFDVIACLENLEHLKNPSAFLRRTTELLVPDGVLICSTPNRRGETDSQNPYHIYEYTEEEFRALLGDYFCDVVIKGQDVNAAIRAIEALWSNPFVRIGRWIQRIRGHRLEQPFTSWLPLTEEDFVISDFTIENARVLISVCGRPAKGQ